MFIKEFSMFSLDDYTKNLEKMMAQSPIKVDDLFKSVLDYNTNISKIALDTMKKNSDLTQSWAKETLSSLDPFVKAQDKPEDYVKVTTDFVNAQVQNTPKHIAEFAEAAKKAQLDTIDVVMKAGKEVQEEISAASKKSATKTSS
jgi:hypothetical protein